MLIKKLLFLQKTEKNDQNPIYAPIMLEKGLLCSYLCRHNFFLKKGLLCSYLCRHKAPGATSYSQIKSIPDHIISSIIIFVNHNPQSSWLALESLLYFYDIKEKKKIIQIKSMEFTSKKLPQQAQSRRQQNLAPRTMQCQVIFAGDSKHL